MMNRRVVRSAPNPLDKATVVSIFPREIYEVKHTTQPSIYQILAGTKENPAILVVEPSSWWKEVDSQQPLLEITNSSIQVANSIVVDYCNGLLACNMGDMMPGLFFVPGEVSVADIKTKFSSAMSEAEKKQKNWYGRLVQLGDALWARTQGNPLGVPDLMRLAAQELGIDKPWIKDFQSMALVKCISCGNLRNPEYPICPTCKAIADPEKAKKLNLTFAQ
jgi:hypothetical protein